MVDKRLIAFVTVAEQGSMAGAAKKLFISQPSLSQQINMLEHELGFALFVRSRRGMRLTQAGESYYRDMKSMMRFSHQALMRAQSVAEAHSAALRVGTMNSRDFLIYRVCTDFCRRYPEIPIEYVTDRPETMPQRLAENRVDVAEYCDCALLEDFGCKFTPIRRVDICCIMPRGHRLAGCGEIRLEDLAGEKLCLYPRRYCAYKDKLRQEIQTRGLDIEVIDVQPEESPVKHLLFDGRLSLHAQDFYVDESVCVKAPFYLPEPVFVGLICLKDAGENAKRFIGTALENMQRYNRS